MKRYEIMSKEDAKAAGLWDGYIGDYGEVVIENLPDGTKRVIGEDGGEPEDQRLSRDWRWVVPSLNKAFQAGMDGVAEEGSIMTQSEMKTRIDKSVELILRVGGCDGSHHKQWCLDQVLRILLENQYERRIGQHCLGPNETGGYFWNTGIAP